MDSHEQEQQRKKRAKLGLVPQVDAAPVSRDAATVQQPRWLLPQQLQAHKVQLPKPPEWPSSNSNNNNNNTHTTTPYSSSSTTTHHHQPPQAGPAAAVTAAATKTTLPVPREAAAAVAAAAAHAAHATKWRIQARIERICRRLAVPTHIAATVERFVHLLLLEEHLCNQPEHQANNTNNVHAWVACALFVVQTTTNAHGQHFWQQQHHQQHQKHYQQQQHPAASTKANAVKATAPAQATTTTTTTDTTDHHVAAQQQQQHQQQQTNSRYKITQHQHQHTTTPERSATAPILNGKRPRHHAPAPAAAAGKLTQSSSTAAATREAPFCSLTLLLAENEITLSTFCAHLHHFFMHFSSEVPVSVCQSVSNMQMSLLKLIAIFRKYDKLFAQFFGTKPAPSAALAGRHMLQQHCQQQQQQQRQLSPLQVRKKSLSDSGYDMFLYGCGWLLFTVAKAEYALVGEQADLHSMYILLLCVLHFVISSQPATKKRVIQQARCYRPAAEKHANNGSVSYDDRVLVALCAALRCKPNAGGSKVQETTGQRQQHELTETTAAVEETSAASSQTVAPVVEFDGELYEHVRVAQVERFTIFLESLRQHGIVTCARSGNGSAGSCGESTPLVSMLAAENIVATARGLGERYDTYSGVLGVSVLGGGGGGDSHRSGETVAASLASKDGGESSVSNVAPSDGQHRVKQGHWLDERVFLEQRQGATGAPSLRLFSASCTQLPRSATTRQLFATAAPSLMSLPLPESPSLGSASPPRALPRSRAATATAAAAASSPKAMMSPYKPPRAFSSVFRPHSYPAMPRTPVTRMMEAVGWLTSRLQTAEAEPSVRLRNVLLEVSADTPSKLHELVTSLAQRVVFPASLYSALTFDDGATGRSMNGSDARSTSSSCCHRRNLAMRLFYHVLEDMVVAEFERQQQQHPGIDSSKRHVAWLQSLTFHSCLLAVCLEIVAFSYKVQSLAFPAILIALGLRAWDLIKVVESVVRHAGRHAAAVGRTQRTDVLDRSSSSSHFTSLPRSVKAHLRNVEVRIVEELAWRRSDVLQSLLTVQENRAFLRSCAAFPCGGDTSTVLKCAAMESPVGASRPSSANQCALELFFRKLLSLAGDRLDYMCSLIPVDVPTKAIDSLWLLVQYILCERVQLLYDRHLDTLLLCSLYAVLSRVCEVDVTFQTLVVLYLSKWPQNSAVVIRKVQLGDPLQFGSIIKFYNDVYVADLKNFIVGTIRGHFDLGNVNDAASPSADAVGVSGPLASLCHGVLRCPMMPRRGVAANSNVYLSPLRHSAREVSDAEVGAVSTYSFGESPSGHLAAINRKLGNV